MEGVPKSTQNGLSPCLTLGNRGRNFWPVTKNVFKYSLHLTGSNQPETPKAETACHEPVLIRAFNPVPEAFVWNRRNLLSPNSWCCPLKLPERMGL